MELWELSHEFSNINLKLKFTESIGHISIIHIWITWETVPNVCTGRLMNKISLRKVAWFIYQLFVTCLAYSVEEQDRQERHGGKAVMDHLG